jgi:predicted DNA-binding protein YlxM (UPF0122 family)
MITEKQKLSWSGYWETDFIKKWLLRNRLYQEVVTEKQTLSWSGYWETDFIKKRLLRNRLYHKVVTEKQTLSWSGYWETDFIMKTYTSSFWDYVKFSIIIFDRAAIIHSPDLAILFTLYWNCYICFNDAYMAIMVVIVW